VAVALVLLFGVCLMQAPTFAEDAPQLGAEAPPPHPPVKLKLAVNTININRHLRFNEQGNVAMEHNNMSLQVRFTVNPELPFTAYQVSRLGPLKTSGGHLLEPMQQSRLLMRREGQPQKLSFQTVVQKLGNIRGQITHFPGRINFYLPSGEPLTARARLTEDLINKTYMLNGNERDWVRTELQNNRYFFHTSREMLMRIKQMNFYDGAGNPIAARHWGTNLNNNSFARIYALQLPEDAEVEFIYHTDLLEIQESFELRDIPLPQGPVDDVFEMSMLWQPPAR